MKLSTYLSALRKCERFPHEEFKKQLLEGTPWPSPYWDKFYKKCFRHKRLADKLERRIIDMYDSLDRTLSYVVKKEVLGE